MKVNQTRLHALPPFIYYPVSGYGIFVPPSESPLTSHPTAISTHIDLRYSGKTRDVPTDEVSVTIV